MSDQSLQRKCDELQRRLDEAQAELHSLREDSASHLQRHAALKLLRVTLESIGDAVITTDAHGTIDFVNPVAEKLTGWSNSDAHGQPLEAVFRIVNETTGLNVECPVSQCLREGRTIALANHTSLLAREGSRFPIEDSAAPIRDDHGRLLGAVLVFRDVSERRQAEETVRVARSRLDATLVAAEIGTWDYDITNDSVWADPNLGLSHDWWALGKERTITCEERD